MPEFIICGVPVNFPFEPYQVQRDYMEKVLECLQNSTNGVLESPTGTGKTLSLLCSTLAWVLTKKAQVQLNMRTNNAEMEVKKEKFTPPNEVQEMLDILNSKVGSEGARLGVPKIIYASRTHSQLSQAIQEMKNTSYNFMKAIILGSRDQLCIHPDVSKEEGNATKTNLCKAKITTRTCSFYSRVEQQRDRPEVRNVPIMDIEDLVKVGQKVKACPFFLSKELVSEADIIFMPYNYLLDPKARRGNNFEIQNAIIILDEAHNVEKMCEDSASMQIKSSDIALCIDDVTSIMKVMDSSMIVPEIDEDSKKDFTLEDLALLKEMLLSLEKVIDDIPVKFSQGSTQKGTYIFDILGKANILEGNVQIIQQLLDSLIQYVATISDKNAFIRRGGGLQTLAELLSIVFSGNGPGYIEAIEKCYKVHIEIEEQKKTRGNFKKNDGWIATNQSVPSVKANAKIVSFWCFNPGFGMRQLLGKQARSIILTSGTLAPLKPLISELDIPVAVRLENPHIIDGTQICVKIVSQGPDKEPLNSCYANRDNPKYVSSLGRTILSFCPIIPDGLLIFFPSYPMLNKCKDEWQSSGIWGQICKTKPIFVEPRTKGAFTTTMTDYYAKINDPDSKGAIFMAVCRGKVSEGLDFADNNGRAVIITGLPFPPLMDPRIILKKKYLEESRTKENEIISGDEWYSLEASRAVNQAIGRVIRHRHDYGAILLCDSRFNNHRQKSQLSAWIQGHLKSSSSTGFGPVIGELSRFFRNAEKQLPKSKLNRNCEEINPSKAATDEKDSTIMLNRIVTKKLDNIGSSFSQIQNSNQVPSFRISEYQNKNNIKQETVRKDFFSILNSQARTIDFNSLAASSSCSSSSLVTIHKRDRSFENESNSQMSSSSVKSESQQVKKRKFKLVPNAISLDSSLEDDSEQQVSEKQAPENRIDLLKLIKSSVTMTKYKLYLTTLTEYKDDKDFIKLMDVFVICFNTPDLFYLLKAMRRFVKQEHEQLFDARIKEICI